MKQLALVAIVGAMLVFGALASIADDGPAGGNSSGLATLEAPCMQSTSFLRRC